MPKLIMFIKRKAGLSFNEFRAHYENIHAPLAKSLLVHLSDYSRNFLQSFPSQPEPPYDCITELWFADQAAMQASMAFSRTEEGQALARDEENFMDRAATRVFIADEVR
jgi:uncharacterized protein (TIGR02118 family)